MLDSIHTVAKRLRSFSSRQRLIAGMATAALVAIGGIYALSVSHAANPFASLEAENGTITGPAKVQTDSNASNGSAVKFVSVSPTGGRTVNVSTAAELTAALASAQPGDSITMADGTYSGHFTSTASGTLSAPITLKGSRNAILDGGTLGGGYTFSLGTKNTSSSIAYWKLQGFSVTGGQKGIVWDNVQHSVIDSVSVVNIGEEGVHLRNNSSDNIIENSVITKTGQDTQAYGEGIYIGSAVSNWSTFSQGSADHSNNNQILNNNISYTGAENMDIKEGTHAGIIRGNTLDGSGMCWETGADCNYADSFIDMKGEGWTVSNNTAAHVHVTWKSGTPTNDGFQDHVISNTGDEGSGNNNTFSANKLSDLGGQGFNIQKTATGIKITCDNTVTDAAGGFGNVTCQ